MNAIICKRRAMDSASPLRLRFRAPLALLLALLSYCCGCGTGAPRIDDTYGERRGTSVNGTGVLAGMFEEAGHTVRSWHAISPALDRFDVVVWFPQDFRVPNEEQRDRLEEWLGEKPGRTLIYVGRDYNAAVTYWKTVAASAPADQAPLIQEQLDEANDRHQLQRTALPADRDCGWFILHREAEERRVKSLEGPFSAGVDAANAEIVLAARLEPPDEDSRSNSLASPFWAPSPTRYRSEPLLSSRGDLLVDRVTSADWDQDPSEPSQILVVTNGSFLLNLPLVNREHRKLAGRLIDECGTSKKVVFLEASGDLLVADSDPQRSEITGMELFLVWPINAILLHVAALAIVLCFYAYPIFGRPRELPPSSRSDFGKHIDALGRLLARVEADGYARDRLAEYQQIVKREALPGHGSPGRASPAKQTTNRRGTNR
jgi:hypothetical protein